MSVYLSPKEHLNFNRSMSVPASGRQKNRNVDDVPRTSKKKFQQLKCEQEKIVHEQLEQYDKWVVKS